MTRILILAEASADQAVRATLELVSAARDLAQGGEIALLALCGGEAGLADLARYGKVLAADSVSVDYVPALAAGAVRAAVKCFNPDLVLSSYSVAGQELGPLAGAAIGGASLTGVAKVSASDVGLACEAVVYDGKLTASVEMAFPTSITLLVGARSPAEPLASPASVTRLTGLAYSMTVRSVPPETGGVDITTARKILSIGRGIGNSEAVPTYEALAGLLGAELAGSRPVIDNGWLVKARQVGKSGRAVRPEIYIACGISGAVEHLEGIVAAEYVVAVNTDEGAPILRRANLGIICEMEDFADALDQQLKSLGK